MSNEYFEVVQSLRKHHSLFAQFWTVGRIVEIDHPSMPTAAIVWDRETGAGLQFLINPNYWATLNQHDKAFVISHEIMHVYLDHGRRSLGMDPKQANIAQDIVINHYLVDYFGFQRSELTFGDTYCWRDTCFPGRTDIEPNRCFEYYYEKLGEQAKQNAQGGGGEPGEGDGEGQQTVDVHNFMEDELDEEILEAIQQAAEDLMDSITPAEVEDFEDIVDKGNRDEAKKVEKDFAKQAGTMAGTLRQRIVLSRVVKKRKWETVVAKVLGRFKGREYEKTVETWTRPHKRIEGLMGGAMLPATVRKVVPIRDRVDVWFFMDVSGSCYHLAERFFTAASSIPEDRFRVRGFCFDTRTHEVNFRKGEIKGGGGTAFQPIEQQIQDIVKKEDCKYPQAVFIITDGYGSRVSPEYPDRWHWFLTDGGSKSYIPQDSHTYLLKDYE